MTAPTPIRSSDGPSNAFMQLARLVARPLERFLRIEAASGLLLLAMAALAFLWASSPWAESYHELWQTALGVRIGSLTLQRPLDWFVNDGLMVIFFFVVGLEIRRELHSGELSEPRRAALPAAAALGGMLVPAALYLSLAGAAQTHSGWGIPMATDIAFAVGILTLLGKRVPAALRVLLLALAVIDDLGAILVIALFYSSGIALSGLGIAALGMVGVLALRRFGVRAKLVYVLPGLVTWAGIYSAGIHPTIAGVIIGLMTPVQVSAREPRSPAQSLIETLHPWVAFGIMPIFALANAGVSLSGVSLADAPRSVAFGVAVGLVLGKPVGVLLAIWLSLKLRIGALPLGVTLRHLVVLGLVAGVGFTMALFVAQLAFMDLQLLAAAKLGVLAASCVAAISALAVGRVLLTPMQPLGAARSADEAEHSTAI